MLNRELVFNWFGGEPLLRLDIIRYMMGEINKICERRGTLCRGVMTTNGYLLKRPTIRELESLGFKKFQITLDGPQETHDRLRPLADGRGTFNVILQNITDILALTKNITVTIRVNFDERNCEAVHALLDVLPNEFKSERIEIYFKVIWPHPRYWGGLEWPRATTFDLFKELLTLMKEASGHGFYVSPELFGAGGCLHCQGEFLNYFAITPEGYLHKCTISFELGHRVGRITPEGKAYYNLPKLSVWLLKDPFEIEVCQDCKLLPVCGGGVPFSQSGKRRSYQEMQAKELI
jgi:uncharacterized protein